ncbi:MAG: GNAT family N-acetyltransferase [Verrucomicrobiales bacterium]
METSGWGEIDRDLWKWKYFDSPYSKDIKILTAEEGTTLVASTSRFPFDIKKGGNLFRAYFNVDSMTHPRFRRRGIMKELYKQSAISLSILYSKGTNPEMYRLLMNIDFKPILPNTFLINYLSPFKLLLSRLRVFKQDELTLHSTFEPFNDIVTIKKFGAEFDLFWKRILPKSSRVIVKDASYMNWRYINIPHKKYRCIYRKKKGKIISMVVLRAKTVSGAIVDILWDPTEKSEPDYSLTVSKHYLKECGALKVSCWGTGTSLRKSLKEIGFIDRSETPRFSAYTRIPSLADSIIDGEQIHFVEGDGDSEFS